MLVLGFGSTPSANAQDEPAAAKADATAMVGDVARFLVGGAAALAAHEAGHLLFDVLFDADPRVVHVELGPFPFFAVTHRGDLSSRREFTISSAGFWVQESTNEWLLSRRPRLRQEHAPFVKGVFAFNILNSVGYAMVAFARAGPSERDTRGMSRIGVDERVIGALVLAPAALDAYRYFRPASRWAAWTARTMKVASVLLVMK
jgi:hypothetical protein